MPWKASPITAPGFPYPADSELPATRPGNLLQPEQVRNSRGTLAIETFRKFESGPPAEGAVLGSQEFHEVLAGNWRGHFLLESTVIPLIELGSESAHQFHFFLQEPADVHDEIRGQVTVLDVMVHRFRTPMRLGLPELIQGDDLDQSGIKTGVRHQFGRSTVVRVPVLQGIRQDYFRLATPNGLDDLSDRILFVLEEPVLQA